MRRARRKPQTGYDLKPRKKPTLLPLEKNRLQLINFDLSRVRIADLHNQIRIRIESQYDFRDNTRITKGFFDSLA
ncbi:MAG: hypothetical protein GTO24_03735 [candidate division Zixibacteria bacterium]|nr:hypothetical protein [candidate division Zixibacteria bacterium]